MYMSLSVPIFMSLLLAHTWSTSPSYHAKVGGWVSGSESSRQFDCVVTWWAPNEKTSAQDQLSES